MTSFHLNLNKQPGQNTDLCLMCRNAFTLINSGQEMKAKENFPMEYHFIKKHLPGTLDELMAILSAKLELH